jgi:hypothetical protein
MLCLRVDCSTAPTRLPCPLFGIVAGDGPVGLSGMDNGVSANSGQCKNNFRRIRIDTAE